MESKAGFGISVRQAKPSGRARLSTYILLSMAGLQSLSLAAQELDMRTMKAVCTEPMPAQAKPLATSC